MTEQGETAIEKRFERWAEMLQVGDFEEGASALAAMAAYILQNIGNTAALAECNRIAGLRTLGVGDWCVLRSGGPSMLVIDVEPDHVTVARDANGEERFPRLLVRRCPAPASSSSQGFEPGRGAYADD